jgi:NTE family protein
VASIIGSHTPEELKEFYDGDRLFKTAWRWNKLRDGFSGKGFANQQQLEIFLRENIGDLTFEEAFAKSGKHINVSISAVGANQKSRLMNELTSPYLLVWSAVLASCAVPLLFPPVTLTSKTADGSSRPYMHLERWVDGSMRNDMPKKRLMRLYNVNYFIASQVNPHIVPLLESERRRIARTRLTSLPRRFIKTQAKLLTMGTLQVIHDASRNEALRQSLNHAYSMISQNYYGDVTIAPERYTLRHYANMLQNPTKESIIWFRQQGERATWPKVDQIRIQAKISRKLRDTIDKLEKSSLTLQDTHQQEVVVG